MIKPVFKFTFSFIPDLENPGNEVLEIGFANYILEYDKFEVDYVQNTSFYPNYSDINLGYLKGTLYIKKDKCPKVLYDFHYLMNYEDDYWKDLDYISFYFWNLEAVYEEPNYTLFLDITKNTLKKLKRED